MWSQEYLHKVYLHIKGRNKTIRHVRVYVSVCVQRALCVCGLPLLSAVGPDISIHACLFAGQAHDEKANGKARSRSLYVCPPHQRSGNTGGEGRPQKVEALLTKLLASESWICLVSPGMAKWLATADSVGAESTTAGSE